MGAWSDVVSFSALNYRNESVFEDISREISQNWRWLPIDFGLARAADFLAVNSVVCSLFVMLQRDCTNNIRFHGHTQCCRLINTLSIVIVCSSLDHAKFMKRACTYTKSFYSLLSQTLNKFDFIHNIYFHDMLSRKRCWNLICIYDVPFRT